MSFTAIALTLAILATASPVFADQGLCESKVTNGMVTLVLCPPDLDENEFRSAGKAACGSRMPCGAWIWVNEADVPSEAPDSHDKLDKEDVRSARAVWVNEKSELIMIQKN